MTATTNSETSKTTQNTETLEPGYTFGGLPIDFSEPEAKAPETSFSGVSLVDDQPNKGLATLIGSNEPPKLTDEELGRKIDRFSFALHKDFSREDIQKHLSTGNEEQLRQYAAASKDIRDERERTTTLKDILSEGIPEDPEKQSVLYRDVKALHGYKPSNNPMTVVEEAYAHRFIESVPLVGPENSATNRLIATIGTKVSDEESRKRVEEARDDLLATEETGKRIKLYQENAKDVLEKAEQRYASESLFGKIVDFGKSAVPFYDYYNMVMDVPGMEAVGLLPGTTVAQWITKLYDQPPAVQKQWLNDAVDRIGAYNPQLAVRVAEAAVSYSTVDQFLDNAFGVMDITDTGGAALGIVKVAGRALEKREAINAFKAAIKADADPRRDPADFKAAMGDINGAAVHNVATSGSRDPKNPRSLSSTTPSFMNPVVTPGGSEGLAAAQSARFSDFIAQRAEKLKASIDRMTRINRLPEEALQAALDGAKREFEEVIGQNVNNAIQNARFVKLDALLARKAEREGRELDLSGVPNISDPNAILEPKDIPSNDPMKNQLTSFMERKQQAKDERDALYKELEAEGKVTPPKERASDVVKMTVDGRAIRPELTPENIAKWEFHVTKPDGSTFSSEHGFADMHKWARLMGLDVGDYGARQIGNGWVMTVTRPVDETKPYVRNALITTRNTTNPLTPLLGKLKHGGGRVSEFTSNNRIAYVVGQEKMREVIEPLAKDLLALKGEHVDALNRVMMEEMNRIDPATNLPGMFFENLKEFESAYRRLNGRSPTTKEVNAYIAARTLNDLEYGLRNSSAYKEYARLGIKSIELRTKKIDEKTGQPIFGTSKFEGKVIDELPLGAGDAKARAMVTVYHEGQEPKIVPLHALMTENRQNYIKDLQGQGYKIIQTANPSRKPGKEVFGEAESVNFIITKDFHQRELGTDIIPYREGWHQIYPYQHYVKQPTVRKIEGESGVTHHLYEGETTLMGVHSAAEAKKYAQAMETARQIAFEGRSGDLDRHLAETLPYDRKKFLSLFDGENPSFSKTEPFHALVDGAISMDAYRSAMEARYPNLYDTIRSPWNLMNQVDKKFMGHRDEVLHTVKEGKGTQGNPVFNLVRAERLDPLSAMSEGMTNMIRNQHMIDMRLQFGESWISEFKHILKGNDQEIYNDVVNTILNKPYIDNVQKISPDDYMRAENARNAFLELLNLETPMQAEMESLRNKVIDHIYETRGQAASNEWATSNVMTTKHPAAFFRGVLYHAKVGMLNPIPAIQNVMQTANAVAVSPKHGLPGFAFGFFAHLTRLNAKPEISKALGSLAEKATGGVYRKEWFEEATTALRQSGFWTIGGGHSFADHLNDPKFIRTKAGQALDATGVLFKESERLLRSTAFMTAYLEHRSANPSKAFTSIDLNEVLGRANLFAGRMTRDEKARWQSGEVASTFTQFYSYQARLMEMIWEKGHGRKDHLTGMEKLRLIGMNSVLYGLPIGGLGTLAGGVVNSYDHIKKELVDRGIDIEDGVLDGLFNGVIGHMSREALGVNVSPTLGPQGRDLWGNLEKDDGWLRFALSPSGAFLLDAYHSASPLMRSAWLAVNGEINPKAIPGDLLGIARNVSSLDKMTKMYLAYKYNKVYTKTGQEIDEVETWPGLVSAITGQMPTEIDHDMWHGKITSNLPQIKSQLSKQAEQDLRLSHEAGAKGDHDLEAFYLKRANLQLNSLGSLSERQEVIRKAINGAEKTLVDEYRQQWEKHHPEVSDKFKKTFGKYFSNIPGNN